MNKPVVGITMGCLMASTITINNPSALQVLEGAGGKGYNYGNEVTKRSVNIKVVKIVRRCLLERPEAYVDGLILSLLTLDGLRILS